MKKIIYKGGDEHITEVKVKPISIEQLAELYKLDLVIEYVGGPPKGPKIWRAYFDGYMNIWGYGEANTQLKAMAKLTQKIKTVDFDKVLNYVPKHMLTLGHRGWIERD